MTKRELISPADMTKSEPLKTAYREWAECFEKLLRMSTYPLAVKMCEKDEDIPKSAKRPLKDFGHYLDTCQCFATSRRIGEMIVQKQEDAWCFESVLAFGFTGGNLDAFNEGLKFFLDGKTRYPEAAKDLAISSKWAHKFPRFEPGKYLAIVSAPLMRASFEPDLVLLYINPTQLNLVLEGIVYKWGDDVTCDLAAHGGCVHYVVPPILTQNFWVSIPCNGDCAFACKEPEELVFSTPLAKVEQLLDGMQALSKIGWGLPVRYEMRPEGLLPPSYAEIAKIMKMHRALVGE